MGRLVKLGEVEGYLGRPSGEGPWPTIIVIQEWWGLDNQTESIVDRFAGLHYLAFAPDLYHGEVALLGDDAKATILKDKYVGSAPEDLNKTFDVLKSHQDCNGKIGTVGFCFGGRMALLLGANRPVDALCSFYGGGMQNVFGQLNTLKAPVLGLYGDQDKSIPAGTVQEFDKLLDKIGVQHEVVIYPGTGHAFMRDRDPSTYKPEAARDAWERATKFFEKNLS